jgi:hypothetical protein
MQSASVMERNAGNNSSTMPSPTAAPILSGPITDHQYLARREVQALEPKLEHLRLRRLGAGLEGQDEPLRSRTT